MEAGAEAAGKEAWLDAVGHLGRWQLLLWALLVGGYVAVHAIGSTKSALFLLLRICFCSISVGETCLANRRQACCQKSELT